MSPLPAENTPPVESAQRPRRSDRRALLALLVSVLMLLGALPNAFAGGTASMPFRSNGLKGKAASTGQATPEPAAGEATPDTGQATPDTGRATPDTGPASPAPTASGDSPKALTIGLPLNYAEIDRADLEARLDDARAAGVTTIHSGAVWSHLCRERTCDYSDLDAFVAAAQERNLSITLQVTGVPDWVHPDLAGQSVEQRRWTLPRNDTELRQFQEFLTELADRYRGRVSRYEIWNEPNLAKFAQPAPSPAVFARTLAAGYRGVKASDPAAIVVSGGLSRADVGFASATIRELDSMPGAAENNMFFDEFGVHPYSDDQSPEVTTAAKVASGTFGTVDNNFSGVARITALLDAHGRQDTKVYIGEYGFSTTNTWMAAVPDWRRGYYAALALDQMRADPRVSALIWYAYVPHSATGPEWATMTRDGSASPTFRSIAAANTRALERPWPSAPTEVSEVWTLNASSFGLSAAARSEVFVDGNLLASSDSSTVTVDPRAVTSGSHRVRLVWYDAEGTVVGFTTATPVSFGTSGGR